MIGLLLLSTTADAPITMSATLPCEGIRAIERATIDRPLPFASLREQGKTLAFVRNETGQRVQREVATTIVKGLAGFSRCRFVYSAQIDLACYIGSTLPDSDSQAIAEKLNATADSVGNCLTNRNLSRSDAEPGSTPSVSFGGGARQPFWQVSMVPVAEDLSRVQPEVLILGPAPVAPPARSVRPTPKAKRKAR